MIGVDFLLFIAFSLACVPLVWLFPRAYAFDAVSAWTLAALLAYSPATAAWIMSIAVGLPILLAQGKRRKDTLAAVLSLLIAAAFVFSRLTPGWGWIGGAFFTLRALHVVIEWRLIRHATKLPFSPFRNHRRATPRSRRSCGASGGQCPSPR